MVGKSAKFPILLTGFQGYGGRAINPAEESVKALQGTEILGHEIHGAILPVGYDRLASRIRSLIARIDPGIVLCIGLWPGEPMIRLERVAVNIADFEIADSEGVRVRNAPVIDGGPAAYQASLPLVAIQRALLERGIPARLSGTAGQFLCNATLYHALHVCAARQPIPLCGFIHVPYLPEQVSAIIEDTAERGELELHQRADLASMPKQTVVEAIRYALEIAIRASVA